MSHSTPIDYIFIEGPDCSGKTTLYEMIHKTSGYHWNIQDRSALSMLIHAKYYGRDTFRHVEQLKRELYNLNNQLIICLPDWDVIVKRFAKRGDPIQNLSSLRKLYNLFFEAAEEFQGYPNVTVIRSVVDDSIVHSLVNQYRAFERKSVHHLRDSMLQMLSTSAANRFNEVIGFNFVHYDTGSFSDIDEEMLVYEKEKDYYQRIKNDMFETIKNELSGNNPYNRKEDLNSRRFIYSDDSCIATCHFLIRDGYMDASFYLRSSNVKDTVQYDLNFLKHLTAQVFKYFKCDRQGEYCQMKFTIGSGHIPLS
jgi:deoxyadenosine/deoxycytidine kinase